MSSPFLFGSLLTPGTLERNEGEEAQIKSVDSAGGPISFLIYFKPLNNLDSEFFFANVEWILQVKRAIAV